MSRLSTAFAFFALLGSATIAAAEPFNFVVLGDVPYGKPAEVNPPFEKLISQINAREPSLVVHVGDTKSGSTLCDNAMLDQQLAYLNSFSAPTLYSPGDNEWTDCHRKKAGGFDPIERLGYIRSTYFTKPNQSFGKNPIAVTSQAAAGFPENTRMMMDDVMFVTAHVVGSNNNFEPRTRENVAEYFERNAATVKWLRDSFAAATADSKALVLAIHADMFEFDFGPAWDAEGFLRQSGFKQFGEALIEEANAYGRPVLLMFGDSHIFRVFRPFPKKAPTVTAVETFGSRDMHAVEVRVDTSASFPFAIQPLINLARPIKPAG